jgi:hypothetical protein
MTKKLLRLVYAASENKMSAELFQSARLFFTSFFKKKYFLLPSFGVFSKSFMTFFFFPPGAFFFFFGFGCGVHYGAGKDLSFLISFLPFSHSDSFLQLSEEEEEASCCLFAVRKISDVLGFLSF